MMSRWAGRLLVVVGLAAATPAFSQALGPDMALGLTQGTHPSIFDQVTGGCWTNASTVLANSMAALDEGGIDVLDYQPAIYTPYWSATVLSALGQRTSRGACLGSARFDVLIQSYQTFAPDTDQPWEIGVASPIFSKTALFSAAQDLNAHIASFFNEAIDEFLARIERNRQDATIKAILARSTRFVERPVSEEEYRQLVNERAGADR